MNILQRALHTLSFLSPMKKSSVPSLSEAGQSHQLLIQKQNAAFIVFMQAKVADLRKRAGANGSDSSAEKETPPEMADYLASGWEAK